MKDLKFKTNIKCMGCVAAVTSSLDETVGQGAWSVDLQHPDKVLTVTTDNGVPAETVVQALQRAGYQGSPVEDGKSGA